MEITHQQVVEWLGKIKLQGSQYNFHRLLGEEEKAKIASVIVSAVNRHIEAARQDKGQ